ncbi:alanine racemase [Akkermansiaceae bacterium]|nr:alanine racemase [Akkermansiaceae bacterium]
MAKGKPPSRRGASGNFQPHFLSSGLAEILRAASLTEVTEPELPVSPPRAWVEIQIPALLANLAFAREASGCAIMAVVKAGAYGHGLEEISRALADGGVEFLGVANIGEARRIREAGIATRIYLLGATWEQEREEIVARNITPCISTVEEGIAFDAIAARRGVTLPVHIAVDTGMGRGGFLPEGIAGKVAQLEELANLEIEGIASHLSSSDEDEEFTNRQIASFEETVRTLGGAQRFRWRHLSNSGGILGYPQGCCNLARPGLMLYGVSPLPALQEKLRNVMSLKSRVTLVRTVPAGHGISYGRSFVTTRPTSIATVGIGYGDGYPRHVSGKGACVFIRGERHPIAGRVTMDQIVVVLPDDSEVRNGDEAELFGPNIPAAEVAALADTIVWDIFTGITPRVQRIHLGAAPAK